MYPPAIYSQVPSEEILEGTTVWHVTTDKGNEYWGWASWNNTEPLAFSEDILNCERESIVNFDIRFRSHIFSLPPNKDGYFFRLGVLGNPSNGTKGMYTVGYIENNQVYCSKFIVPEIYKWSEEVRSIEQCQSSLIKRINPSTGRRNP